MLLWSSRMKYCTVRWTTSVSAKEAFKMYGFHERQRAYVVYAVVGRGRTGRSDRFVKTSIPGETIERRFAIFGGVARGCITLNEAVVSRRIRELQREINDIDSLYVGMANLKML
ncbi:hypothetical protein GQ600_23262 [Phytophthora cactorum]|nr:hypothetical protein GQ600_23262 [Phytophthora cactorum]